MEKKLQKSYLTYYNLLTAKIYQGWNMPCKSTIGKSYSQIHDYDKNKELSYLTYCDINNLNGWPMFQKFPQGFRNTS